MNGITGFQRKFRDGRAKLAKADADRRAALAALDAIDDRLRKERVDSRRPRLPRAFPLMRDRDAIAARVAAARLALDNARNDLAGLRGRLAAQSGPQEQVTSLADETPVLLLPVNIQTRFMRIKHVTRRIPPGTVLDAGRLPRRLRERLRSNLSALAAVRTDASGSQALLPALPRLVGRMIESSSGRMRLTRAPRLTLPRRRLAKAA